VVYRYGAMRFEFGGLYLARLDPKLTYNCPLFHDNRLMPYSGEDKSSGRDYERCRQRRCIYTFAADDSSRFETSKWFPTFLRELTFLVLYSRAQHSWKIADFGLTTEGTSQRSYTTHYSRGTSSYRAPELVRSGTYNNKVDIWALGCILYEIVTLRKAFSTDNAVYEYSMQQALDEERVRLPLDLSVYKDEWFEKVIGDLLHTMLEIDSSMRPSAADLMLRLELAFRERELDSESEAENMTL